MSQMKQRLIQSAIAHVREMISSAADAKNVALQESQNSENTVGDRYNVLRESALILSEGHALRLSELHRVESDLLRLSHGMRECDGVVHVSSLVTLESTTGVHHTYLIVPSGGGFTFAVDDLTVTTLSAEAPIAVDMLGKSESDEVVMGSIEYTITTIQ